MFRISTKSERRPVQFRVVAHGSLEIRGQDVLSPVPVQGAIGCVLRAERGAGFSRSTPSFSFCVILSAGFFRSAFDTEDTTIK